MGYYCFIGIFSSVFRIKEEAGLSETMVSLTNFTRLLLQNCRFDTKDPGNLKSHKISTVKSDSTLFCKKMSAMMFCMRNTRNFICKPLKLVICPVFSFL